MIFLFAFGVRFFSWQDNRHEAGKVETFVTAAYKEAARQLQHGNVTGFIRSEDSKAHPPGYSILLALIFKVFGESDTAIQFTQIFFDSLAAVFVFLIAAELLPLSVAVVSGCLAALSPQFAYYATLLVPDSLSVLPVLIATYFLIRAIKRPRLSTFVLAGAFIGLSCWLRANALLLPPFIVCFTPLLLKRGERLRSSLAIVFSAIAVIAPITIKNAIAFHRFIPLSLGAGQKLLEGIAEFDQGRFDIPKTDLEIMRQEAEMYQHPQYGLLLFGPDGPERDRLRIRRGVGVITTHPLWYSSVMIRRGFSFFKLARTPVTSADPPVTHDFELANQSPMWSKSATEFFANPYFVSPQAKVTSTSDGRLTIETDERKYGAQIVSPEIPIEPHHDYLLRLPLKLQEGRLLVSVVDANQSRALYSVPVELTEGVAAQDQPIQNLSLLFVSSESQIRLSLANNASASTNSLAEVGSIQLFDLGPSSQEWMRYPRLPIRILQAFFITAGVVPFLILGIAALLWTRNFRTLILLTLVPLYFIIFQSALHTERRYVVAIHYFFLILVAMSLSLLIRLTRRAIIVARTRST
jgi:hypothetical protein